MGEAKHGMEKIFRGLMTYRLTHQRNMVDQFKKVKENMAQKNNCNNFGFSLKKYCARFFKKSVAN